MSLPRGILSLRSFARRHMTEPTEILRSTEVEVEAGYPRLQWSTIATVKSWATPLSQREALVANQMQYRVDGTRYLPVGTDVLPKDRLKVGEKTFEIAGIQESTPDMQPYMACLVSRIE